MIQVNLTKKCHNHNWATTWDFQECGMCDHQILRSACAYAQSDQSLCLSLEYSMSVKLLTEHQLVFLRLKGSCACSSVSTLVKMSHCWKSHVAAQLYDSPYIKEESQESSTNWPVHESVVLVSYANNECSTNLCKCKIAPVLTSRIQSGDIDEGSGHINTDIQGAFI